MESLDLEDAYSRSPADCKPHQVTQKKNDFRLGLEQQEAFEQVKEEVVRAVPLGPVRTKQDVNNVLCATARKNGPSWALEKSSLMMTPGVLEPALQRI